MPSTTWPLRPRLAIIAASLLVTGCGGGEQPSAQPTDLLGPLTALPACEPPPTPAEGDVAGLIVPPGTVVTTVTPQDPLVNVTGYVAMTPVQFELSYQDMAGIEVLQTENEVYEAELLVTDGSHRNFLKATAACREGSQLLVIVAPELAAEDLPAPRGQAGTPTP